MRRFALAVTIALLVAGCSPAADPLPGAVQPTEAFGSTPSDPTRQAGPIPQATPAVGLASQAIHILASYLGIPESDVVVESVTAVDWADASLGCPQEGMAYAQVITPGAKVVLEAGGQRYEVHADATLQAVLCDDAGRLLLPPIPINPGDRIQDGQPWVPVD